MKIYNNKKNFLFFALFPFLLTSCNYGNIKQVVFYENYFYPWPTGVSYSSIIDCNKSFFKCNYEYEYDYYLLYKDGTEVRFNGKYKYSKDSFILLNETGETLLTLKQSNYYRFVETITYDEQNYKLIWHARNIFD